MKIIIYTQHFWPENFSISEVAAELSKRGHDVSVVTGMPNYPKGKYYKGYSLFGPYIQLYQGVRVLRVPLVPRGSKKGAQLILNYLSFPIFSLFWTFILFFKKADLIFVYQTSPVSMAFPAMVHSFISGKRLYLWVLDLWPETLRALNVVKNKQILGMIELFVRTLYHRSIRVLISSEGFRARILQRGLSPDKVIYWPQFSSQKISTSEPVNHSSVRLLGEFKLLFAGNIGKAQNIPLMIEAAQLLKVQHPQIVWNIVGQGSELPAFKHRVQELHMQSVFNFVDQQPQEMMPTIYEQADVLLLTLIDDELMNMTLPAKAVSYLAAAKPIVACLGEEPNQTMLSSGAAYVGAPSDPIGFAKNIEKIFCLSSEQRLRMGELGKQYFAKNFSKEMLLNQLENLFRDDKKH